MHTRNWYKLKLQPNAAVDSNFPRKNNDTTQRHDGCCTCCTFCMSKYATQIFDPLAARHHVRDNCQNNAQDSTVFLWKYWPLYCLYCSATLQHCGCYDVLRGTIPLSSGRKNAGNLSALRCWRKSYYWYCSKFELLLCENVHQPSNPSCISWPALLLEIAARVVQWHHILLGYHDAFLSFF